MSTATTTTASNAATMDASAQQTRKKEIVKRLNEISLPVFKIQPKRKATSASAAASTDKAVVLVPEKTEDTHWNFLLKEMQWLSADFTAERKRHVAASKKMATSVAVYCAGAHQRDARAIADATAKRRKLAAKLSRECVVKWWGKLDRVITYKQKIRYDQSRADAMNQQLVKLVHQTEKYTASLGSSKRGGAGSGSLWSIEQALSSTQGTRRSKQRVRDYARLLHDEKASGGDGSVSTNNNNHFLYGKSTEDSGLSSDATWYSHDNDDDDDDERHTAGSRSGDDESTMRAAEKEEEREPRKQARNESNDHSMDEEDEDENDTRSFVADPVELLKLQQESTMDIDLVLERLRQEAGQSVGFHKEEDDAPGAEGRPDPGSDADDDMDASDVEDYDNRNAQKEDDDEEFVVDGDAPDDERTMEQEEQLPPESTADEELSLLQQENELTVDELRERYRLLADQALLQYNDDGEEEKVKELTSDDPEDIDPENQEYEPEEELDDERTMEAEEKLGRDMTHEEELATLKRESEMSVEQLRDLYRGMNGNDESVVAEESGSETQDSAPPAKFHELLESVEDHENDEEFYPDDNAEKDDETTMEIEEQLGPEMSAEQEIALLQKESEMSVSELRLLYQPVDAENDQEHGIIPLKRKTSQSIDELGSEKSRQHARLDEVDKIQPSEEIDMKIMASRPFLIPSWVKLREYQHIGLNWLVSLQERRLNGILADGKSFCQYTFLAIFSCLTRLVLQLF